MDLQGYAAALGLTFKNLDLLEEALTHRSYINENKGAKSHNERLEFLGDAVLELAVTKFLFTKFPDSPEGDLTAYRAALVNTFSLAEVAEALEMSDMLLLSKGEKRDIGRARQIILADAFEAIIGAVYLDQGYDAAEVFIGKHLYAKIDGVVKNRSWQDAKSKFQEHAQDEAGVTPRYKTLSEEGPDHDKKFIVGVYIGEKEIARGDGKSKQEAEQDAAKNGLNKKGW